MSETIGALEVHPLTPDRWADFEALFLTMGKHSGCWCMWWRLPNKAYDAGAGNKASMQALVHADARPGLLGYWQGQAIGWVSLAPRAEYVRFARANAPTFKSPDDLPVWSVVCFYVHPDFRKQGVARQLLRDGAAYAREHGATLLEAYPTDPEVTSRVAATDLNLGTQSLFARAGFVEVARNKPNRPIMRRALAADVRGGDERAGEKSA